MSDTPSLELPGSVKYYQCHLFVSTPTDEWPSHIERDSDSVGEVTRLIQEQARENGLEAKVTAYCDPAAGEAIEILSFPEGRIYRLHPSEAGAWALSYFRGQGSPEGFQSRKAEGTWIFVCSHGSRDQRCGDCAPNLIHAFEAELVRAQSASNIRVFPCSHLGGHHFAGNVVVYPRGDWYGQVTPEKVSHLVEHSIVGDEVCWDLWRGRAGLNPDEQKRLFAARASGCNAELT